MYFLKCLGRKKRGFLSTPHPKPRFYLNDLHRKEQQVEAKDTLASLVADRRAELFKADTVTKLHQKSTKKATEFMNALGSNHLHRANQIAKNRKVLFWQFNDDSNKYEKCDRPDNANSDNQKIVVTY